MMRLPDWIERTDSYELYESFCEYNFFPFWKRMSISYKCGALPVMIAVSVPVHRWYMGFLSCSLGLVNMNLKRKVFKSLLPK